MYGGDDINAVVLDIGSLYTKAGYAGDDLPKSVFHTAVGTLDINNQNDVDMMKNNNTISSFDILNDPPTGEELPHNIDYTNLTTNNNQPVSIHDNKMYYCGRTQLLERPSMNIVQPIINGTVTDWNAIECNINYAFNINLSANLSEHPLLLSQPVYTSSTQREKLLELLFDKFSCPATFFAKQPVLAAFSSGRASATVLSMGHQLTTVIPVNDGYVLHKGIRRTKMSGAMLDELCEKVIPSINEHTSSLYSPSHNTHNITSSYTIFRRSEILRDIKETSCKLTEHTFDINSNIKLPSQQYILPDGRTIDINNERFIVTEQLFRPQSQYCSSVLNHDIDNNYTFNGLHKMITQSIDQCDADLRRLLYENIVLSGGSTLLGGLSGRLQREISGNIGPLYKVKILHGSTISDRRYSDWLGGSILASLGSFHQMWISKQEYHEYGNQIIHKKCP